MKRIFFILLCNFHITYVHDLTIVGYICGADGIGSIPIRIIDCLKLNDLKINWINSRDHIQPDFNNLPVYIKNILKNKNNDNANVGIFTDLLYYDKISWYEKMPKDCKIKFAYSMIEGSRIPSQWVNILNNNFDGTIVPDKSLIEVYKNSGVKIPIFVIPLALLDLHKLFKNKGNKRNNDDTFVFGNTCALVKRKNHIKLIEAFVNAFGNNKNVKLVINSRAAEADTLNNVKKKIQELNANNIELNLRTLSREEYITLLNSFNCYVSISQGEGFAIPPRESIALGIPTILTNNTAHKTICDSGFAKSVNSNILVPATYAGFDNHKTVIGYSYDCSVKDVSNALLEVYYNYNYYVQLTHKSKQWIKKYLTKNLKYKYLSLIKPKKIIFGKNNMVANDYLITNSENLYNKYINLKK